MKRLCLFLLSLATAVSHANAQSAPNAQSAVSPDALHRTVASLDSSLFDAYNRCDLPKFASLLSENVEFYHDVGGVTLGAKDLTESIRRNICGKLQRTLVPGTLEVYPIHGYGAVEMGAHLFRHPNPHPDDDVSQGKFVILWRNTNGVWKITRVISYDHHPAAH